MSYIVYEFGRAAVVTPSNTADIPSISGGTNQYCSIYIGVTGDVTVRTEGGDDVLFKNAQAGSVLPIKVIRVFAAGTSATNIVALW